jgi:hypothetical protein
MASFYNGVSPPRPASYAPAPLSFSEFGQWAAADPSKSIFDKQQQQLNQQRLQQGQKQIDLADAFKDGMPTNPDGSPAYDKMVARIVQLGGDPSVLLRMEPLIQRQQAANTPEFAPGPSGQPVAAPGPAPAATAAKIIQVEGGGKNPRSSADGVGQFTDSTWVESIKKYFPNLAQGRSDDQILDMRKIAPLATRVTEAFTAGNEAGLSKAGLPVTPATTYLAHFAGLGGASKVLEANPNTPVEKLLSPDAIKANKFLQGMTARDLELWAARKMQGPAMVAQNAQAPQGGAGGTRMADASSGDLPPSAGLVSPAPQITRQPPQGGGSPQPPQGQPQQLPPLVQPQQQQVQPPAAFNFKAADAALDLNPQEKALYRRHLTNLTGPGGVNNADGTRSTLKDITVESEGKTYVIPTVYGGKILSNDEAWNRAKTHLKDFPAYASEAEASARYSAMHDFMNQDTEGYQRGQQGGQQPQPQQRGVAQPAPQAAPAQPQPPQGRPLTPQWPLPVDPKTGKRFEDPMQAILSLRTRADDLETQNPYLKTKADGLRNYADAIQKSISPVETPPGTSFVDPVTRQPLFTAPTTAQSRVDPAVVGNIVKGIVSGDQPPTLSGLYSLSGPVRSGLVEAGFNLEKAQLEQKRAEKQIATLNGSQMTKFVGLASSVDRTIDEVRDLSEQLQNSGVPAYNRFKMEAYAKARGNTPEGQLVARYVGAVNTLKEEFSNLAQGGYAPTEATWKLANDQINGDYGVKQLGASLDEIQRLIRYRVQAIPGLSQLGPGAPNRYTGQEGQSSSATPSQSSPPAGSAPPSGKTQTGFSWSTH